MESLVANRNRSKIGARKKAERVKIANPSANFSGRSLQVSHACQLVVLSLFEARFSGGLKLSLSCHSRGGCFLRAASVFDSGSHPESISLETN